jgi:hypothetical protein
MLGGTLEDKFQVFPAKLPPLQPSCHQPCHCAQLSALFVALARVLVQKGDPDGKRIAPGREQALPGFRKRSGFTIIIGLRMDQDSLGIAPGSEQALPGVRKRSEVTITIGLRMKSQ